MGLNPQIIRDSFALAVPIADQVATRFYEFLFADYPAVIPLFEQVQPAKQRAKLINSLVYIVGHLEESEKLIPFLNNLGSRHTYYGAEEAHYDAVGATLMKTFQSFLGPKWTPSVAREWEKAFGIIKEQMIHGARQHKGKKSVA